jgi:hypothetical protein
MAFYGGGQSPYSDRQKAVWGWTSPPADKLDAICIERRQTAVDHPGRRQSTSEIIVSVDSDVVIDATAIRQLVRRSPGRHPV